MADVTIYEYDPVRITCAPLQSANPHDNRETIAFYAYRGPGASQFPQLRAADTNKDGQLDFVIGVSNADYRKFLKLDDSAFAPGSQKNPTLWGAPVHVARSALQLQCETIKHDRNVYYVAFAGTTVAGIAMLLKSAALAGSVASTAMGPGFLVLVGLLVIHGGFMLFGNALDKVEDRFQHSLDIFIP